MSDQVDLSVARGEDYACQVFWSDQWNESIPVTDPVEATIKDAVGQVVMRFVSTADATVDPAVEASSQGFFQLTCPRARTWALMAGVYTFDLWAVVSDSAPPFQGQRQQVVQGTMTVTNPVSAYVST